MHISNRSVSVKIQSYGFAINQKGKPILFWLEFLPEALKSVGAIWATLVNGTSECLTIADDEHGRHNMNVYGVGGRYERFESDCPDIAGKGNSKPRFLRLVAPQALSYNPKGFAILDCWEIPLGKVLASFLESGTSLPISLEWGDYLIKCAIEEKWAIPLTTGGGVSGYYIRPDANWGQVILKGIKSGEIRMTEGKGNILVDMEVV